MTTSRIYLYPIWLRIWHVINALSFLILLITGFSLHFADPENGLISFKFAVSAHNICATIITINYGIFLLGNIISGNGKYYRGWKEDMKKNMMTQVKYYISGIFKKEKHPFKIDQHRKFNPLQKLSYVMVMYLGLPVLILTGLGLLFPKTVIENFFGISGMAITAYFHQIIGFILSLFLLIHLYTCTLGDKPGTLFKSIINGYHEEHE